MSGQVKMQKPSESVQNASLPILTENVKPCVKCGATDRYESGNCAPCARTYRAQYEIRKSQPGYKRRDEIKKKCNTCGKLVDRVLFSKKPGAKDGLYNRCKPCQHAYDRRRYVKKYPKGQHIRRVEKRCANCGGEFTTSYKYQGFCSPKCRADARALGIGLMVQFTKEYFCEKYFFTCQKCGKMGDSDDFQVHHVTPLCLGGENTEDNLTLLCTKCHQNEHAVKVRHSHAKIVYRSPPKRKKKTETQSADLF
jgi:5-methylcytosine-specific restriction endonuclease McrA